VDIHRSLVGLYSFLRNLDALVIMSQVVDGLFAKNGDKYGPNGHKGSRGKVTVKPGGTSQDDHWVRGDTFCGGRLEYEWEGKDTNGHRVYLEERINLICK
jgi:hypothetical protein